MKRIRELHHRQDGAAAVEFALISVLLFVVVFGIITFGRVYNEYEVLTNAAREGARTAAVRSTPAQAVAAVEAAADGYTLSSTPAVSTTCDDSTQGQPVTVSWTQVFTIDIPFLPAMSESVDISGVFRCE